MQQVQEAEEDHQTHVQAQVVELVEAEIHQNHVQAQVVELVEAEVRQNHVQAQVVVELVEAQEVHHQNQVIHPHDDPDFFS